MRKLSKVILIFLTVNWCIVFVVSLSFTLVAVVNFSWATVFLYSEEAGQSISIYFDEHLTPPLSDMVLVDSWKHREGEDYFERLAERCQPSAWNYGCITVYKGRLWGSEYCGVRLTPSLQGLILALLWFLFWLGRSRKRGGCLPSDDNPLNA